MPQAIAATPLQAPTLHKEEITTLGGNGKLVVEQVEIVRQRHVVKIPELVVEEVPTTKYIVRDEPTTRYVVAEKPTVCYVAKEQETVKYNVRKEETVCYVSTEVKCEKPVLIDVPYERPVVTNKEYTLVTFKDMELIRELISSLPNLLAELGKLKNYKMVEETIKVPKVQYDPVKVERIVWVDRERDKKTGELADANLS